MRYFFFIIYFFIFSQVFPQVVFTAINHSLNDVRACFFDDSTNEIIELSSNNSYLPVWFDDKIIFNFGNHVWLTDKTGNEQRILFEGVKPVVSKKNKFIAAYTRDGIVVADSQFKILKTIEVNYWDKITPTFSFDECSVSYYDKERESTFLFNWFNETNKQFGKMIYHPTWSPDGKKILLNTGKIDEDFRVGIVDSSWKEGDPISFITSKNENCILPIWSPRQNYIAYMILKSNKTLPNSDFIPGSIILYNISTRVKTVIAEDAGFTEGAYPQFCFDREEKFFYYTAINDLGYGIIARINLKDNYEKKNLTNDINLDCRLPHCQN